MAFPQDGFLGEEDGSSGEGNRLWVIDPIDGTKNFADGVPVWATLLALQVDGRSVLGLASAPALGERSEAVIGQGARCNGRAIHVSERGSLRDAFLVYSSLEPWLDGPRRGAFEALLHGTRRNRGFGDFWGHLLVARGAADVMVESDLALWDWAALRVIVEEAGGRMTTYEGSEPAHGTSILTSNGLLHQELVERLSLRA
jgi:histidinol-phosphatase